MRQRGFTLLELTVYMFLALLAGLAIATLFKFTGETQQASTSSYLVSGNAETAIRWLRQDLQDAALSSIQVYPNETQSSEAPGASMASAHAFDPAKSNELLVNPYGVPWWDKHVYYTLEAEPGKRTGSLVRWENEMDPKDLLPHVASLLPAVQSVTSHRRVVLHSLLAPNLAIDDVGNGSIATDDFGGFRVQFVRRIGGEGGAEQLTTVNPTAGNPIDNTRLVEVELKLLQEGGRYPNYYSIRFRVAPRY